MKEVREVTLLKCDHCGTAQTDDGLVRMGMPILSGWCHLYKTEKKSRDPFGKKDFCSEKCLTLFMLARPVNSDLLVASTKTPEGLSNDGTLCG